MILAAPKPRLAPRRTRKDTERSIEANRQRRKHHDEPHRMPVLFDDPEQPDPEDITR